MRIIVAAVFIAAWGAFPATAGTLEKGHGFRDWCSGPGYVARCMFAGRFDEDRFWDRFDWLSCAEARAILADRGYRRLKTISCKGMIYRFTGQFKGKRYELHLARRDGTLLSVRRAR